MCNQAIVMILTVCFGAVVILIIVILSTIVIFVILCIYSICFWDSQKIVLSSIRGKEVLCINIH